MYCNNIHLKFIWRGGSDWYWYFDPRTWGNRHFTCPEMKLEVQFWKWNPLFDFLTSSGPPESWPQPLYFVFLNWCGTDFVHGSVKLLDKKCVANMNRRLSGAKQKTTIVTGIIDPGTLHTETYFSFFVLICSCSSSLWAKRRGSTSSFCKMMEYLRGNRNEVMSNLQMFISIESKPDLPWDPTPSHGSQGLSPCLWLFFRYPLRLSYFQSPGKREILTNPAELR